MSLEEFGKGHGGAGGTPVNGAEQSEADAARERLKNTPNVYDRLPRPEPRAAEPAGEPKEPIKLPSGELMHPDTHLILGPNRSSQEWQGLVGAEKLNEKPITIGTADGSVFKDITRGDEVATGTASRAIKPEQGRVVGGADQKGTRKLLHEGNVHLRLLADHVRNGLSEYGKDGSDEVVGSLVTAGEHLNNANASFDAARQFQGASQTEKALQHLDAGNGHLIAAHEELTRPHMTEQSATVNMPVGRDQLNLNKEITSATIASRGFKPLGKMSRKVQLGRTAAGLIDLTKPDIAMRITALRRAVKTASRGNSGVTNIQPDAMDKLTRVRTPRFRKEDQDAREAAGMPRTENWAFGEENNPKTPETVTTIADSAGTSGIVGVSPQRGVPGKTPVSSLTEPVAELENPSWKPGIKAADEPEKDMVLPDEEISRRNEAADRAETERPITQRERRIKEAKDKEFRDAEKEDRPQRAVVGDEIKPASKDTIVIGGSGRARRNSSVAKMKADLRKSAEQPSNVTPPKGAPKKITRKPKGSK